jgi:DNA polymerase-3 subunit epsilon
MNLNLKNPIIFFDLETTGLDVCKDRIVQIAYIKVYPNGTEEEKNYLVNPEMPIPTEASAVHGIYDADVADKPTFKELASVLVKDFKGADIAGFNSNRFDIPLLAEEFARVDAGIDLSRSKKIDVQTIFHKKEQRTLTAAYKFYCGKDLDNAHNALADTRATYEVLKGQLDKYSDLENDMTYLSEFTSHTKNVDFAGHLVYNEKGEEVINFGKYKGQLAATVLKNDPGYYGWICNADFPLTTKQAFTRIMLKSKM